MKFAFSQSSMMEYMMQLNGYKIKTKTENLLLSPILKFYQQKFILSVVLGNESCSWVNNSIS